MPNFTLKVELGAMAHLRFTLFCTCVDFSPFWNYPNRYGSGNFFGKHDRLYPKGSDGCHGYTCSFFDFCFCALPPLGLLIQRVGKPFMTVLTLKVQTIPIARQPVATGERFSPFNRSCRAFLIERTILCAPQAQKGLTYEYH